MDGGQLGILDYIKMCGVNWDYRRMSSLLTAHHQMKHFKKEAPEKSLRELRHDTEMLVKDIPSPQEQSPTEAEALNVTYIRVLN